MSSFLSGSLSKQDTKRFVKSVFIASGIEVQTDAIKDLSTPLIVRTSLQVKHSLDISRRVRVRRTG